MTIDPVALPGWLDLVIPAHDEAERIGPTLAAYRAALPEDGIRFLVVLDGCTDGTLDVVRSQQRADPRIEAHPIPQSGKGGALRHGFRVARAPLVGFVDADGATPPSELRRLVDVILCGEHTADVAIAGRRHQSSVLPAHRGHGRAAASFAFAGLVRVLFRLPVADTQCGAKILRSEPLRACLPHLQRNDFLFDVELLAVARRLGFTIAEVPTIWVDQPGSTVHLSTDALRMAAAALRLRFELRRIPRVAA